MNFLGNIDYLVDIAPLAEFLIRCILLITSNPFKTFGSSK